MQSSSNLHSLPHGKNKKGRIELRAGQQELLAWLHQNPSAQSLNVEFPTGYGKTIAVLLAYEFWRQRGFVDRLIVVVPQIEQVRQYLDDLMADAESLGIDLRGVKKLVGDTITYRYHIENRAEVFVTTVQSLGEHIGEFTAKGRWALAADEHQHYASGKSWGDSVCGITVQRTIALSATPLRRDGTWSIFGKPDVQVSLRSARVEEAIKSVLSHVEHYHVDVIDADGETFSVTTESLRTETGASFNTYETKRRLRYDGKYLCSIITNAVSTLAAKQLRDGAEHQMIVYAMTCAHAKHVVEQMRDLPFEGFTVDWIGGGENGRSDVENLDVLRRFKSNELECLVQVDKVGEGFNVKRASVLVFLSLLGETPKAMQQVGRGLRRNPNIKNYSDDVCDIFVSADSAMAEFVKDLEAQIEPDRPPEAASGLGDPGTDGERVPSFPEWIVVSAKYDRTVIFRPLEGGIDAFRDRVKKHVAEEMGWGLSDDAIRAKASPIVDRLIDEILQKKIPATSDDEQLENNRRTVHRAVCALASVLARRRFGKTFPHDAVGDFAKKINGHWRHRVGGHDAMTVSELRQKYEWVRELRDMVASGQEMPPWLQI